MSRVMRLSRPRSEGRQTEPAALDAFTVPRANSRRGLSVFAQAPVNHLRDERQHFRISNETKMIGREGAKRSPNTARSPLSRSAGSRSSSASQSASANANAGAAAQPERSYVIWQDVGGSSLSATAIAASPEAAGIDVRAAPANCAP